MTRRGVASTPPWPKAGLSETSPAGGLRMLTSTWMANATASVLRLTKAPSHSTLASVQLRVVNPEPRAPSEPAPFQLGGFRVPPVEASSCCGKRHGRSTPTPPAGQKPPLTCAFSLQPQRDSNPCRHLEREVRSPARVRCNPQKPWSGRRRSRLSPLKPLDSAWFQ
jgi:hypothetical protein